MHLSVHCPDTFLLLGAIMYWTQLLNLSIMDPNPRDCLPCYLTIILPMIKLAFVILTTVLKTSDVASLDK